jgi:hypothetical protein
LPTLRDNEVIVKYVIVFDMCVLTHALIPREKTEQGNAVDEEYEFTATVKNTNVSTKTNLYRILFIYRVVINFITYFFL